MSIPWLALLAAGEQIYRTSEEVRRYCVDMMRRAIGMLLYAHLDRS